MKGCFTFLLLLLLSLTEDSRGQTPSPVVTTSLGQVVGSRKQDASGNVYDEFLGMAFGAPPVGPLRWQPPQPPSAWEGVRNATQFSPHCIHTLAASYPESDGMSNATSEDCLYLNVWVPGGVQEGPNRPVMLYYYGGAFMFGTGAMYPGYELGHQADIITVSFNYRLSSIGWLSTEDSHVPGNYGLWDGKAALEWIRDNIAAFGGDPNRVTIYGQSAGGAMVSHTTASLQTRNLFHRALAISGGSTGFVGRNRRARQFTELLADWLGCPTDVTADMVTCLRGEDANDLDEGAVAAPALEGYLPLWFPARDGEFVHQDPIDSFASGIPGAYDYLTGATYHDGAGFILGNLFGENVTDYGVAESKEELDEFLRGYIIAIVPEADVNTTLDLIKTRYPGLDSDDVVTRAQVATEATTDWLFKSPSFLEASLHSSSGGGPGRTFAYNYRYRHSFQMYPSWVNGSHSDDLFSWHGTVFRPKFRQEQLGEYNADDLRMRDNLHTVCHNHAYNGSPGTGRPFPFTWAEYNQETRQFARLSAFMTPASLESETADMVSRYQFWIDLMAVTDPIPQEEYMEPLGNFDSYTEEDLIAACDRLLPLIVPGYGQYRNSLLDTLTDAFYRARERRVINLTKWGIRRRI